MTVDFYQVIWLYKNEQFLLSHIIHGLNLASPNMLMRMLNTCRSSGVRQATSCPGSFIFSMLLKDHQQIEVFQSAKKFSSQEPFLSAIQHDKTQACKPTLGEFCGKRSLFWVQTPWHSKRKTSIFKYSPDFGQQVILPKTVTNLCKYNRKYARGLGLN